MQLSRATVIAVCEALDFQAARCWNPTKMIAKLKDIAKWAKDRNARLDDPELNEVLQGIIDSDGKVDVVWPAAKSASDHSG